MGSDQSGGTDYVSQIVSIHAPTWGATLAHGYALLRLAVSIHAPTWGATSVGQPQSGILEVSIHAPTWGATKRIVMLATQDKFQSTLPHGERQRFAYFPYSDMMFQSTLPHGERLGVKYFWGKTLSFNPRSHMGSDPSCLCRNHMGVDVSIHAPTWGATVRNVAASVAFHVSIHAPTWGATARV